MLLYFLAGFHLFLPLNVVEEKFLDLVSLFHFMKELSQTIWFIAM